MRIRTDLWKKMERQITSATHTLKLLVALTTAGMGATVCGAAQLGFVQPCGIPRPGAAFTMGLAAYFAPGETAGWDAGALPHLTVNATLPDNMTVVSCVWNTADWQFTIQETASTNDCTMLTAVAQGIRPGMCTSMSVIATLECLALASAERTASYTTEASAEPFPSTLTARTQGVDGDILGDPGQPDDGTDEFPLIIPDVPGYLLVVQPEEDEIPVSLKGVKAHVIMRHTSPAPPFDNVRIHLAYDPFVFGFTDIDLLADSIPRLFTNVVLYCPSSVAVPSNDTRATMIADRVDGDIVLDAYCIPTNWEGELMVVKLVPLHTEEESEIALDFGGGDIATAVTHADVDVLGSSLDDKDGAEDAAVTVHCADGLRLVLEPVEAVAPVGGAARARLVVRKTGPDAVVFDTVRLDLLYDAALLNCTTESFTPSAYARDTGVSFSLNPSTNPTASISAAFLPWTNTMLALALDWDEGSFTCTYAETELGVLEAMPLALGSAGFLPGGMDITLYPACIMDAGAVPESEWPVVFSVVQDTGATQRMSVTLQRAPGQELVASPGERVRLQAVAHGAVVGNVAYALRWLYDSGRVRFVPSGGTATSRPMLAAGATSDVLCVDGVSVIADGTVLGEMVFQAQTAGVVSFIPATPAMDAAEYSTATGNGTDVLGAETIAGDGVAGCSLVVRPSAAQVRLSVAGPLFAGVGQVAVLSVANPSLAPWDSMSANLLFDPDYLVARAAAWAVEVPVEPVANSVTSAVFVVGDTTGEWIQAHLAFAGIGGTGELRVAALPIMPLAADALWGVDLVETDTYVHSGSLDVSDGDQVLDTDGNEWVVYPNDVTMWLCDAGMPPVLGAEYTLTVRIGNPHGAAIGRATFSWCFDPAMLEVTGARLLEGWTTNDGGFVHIDNYSSFEPSIYADVRRTASSTNASFAVLELTVLPKVYDLLEIWPGYFVLEDDGSETSMGVWNDAGVNVMELLDQFLDDACPVWQRNAIWRDVPQVAIESIALDNYEATVVSLDDVLLNAVSNMTYRWWVEGNQRHVAVIVSDATRAMTLRSVDGWQGMEVFTLCCQEIGRPAIGWTTFAVTVGDTTPDTPLDLALGRTEFISTGRAFRDAEFRVLNATGAVAVTATIRYPDGSWHEAGVYDAASGETGSGLDIRGNGCVVWAPPALPCGIFPGVIEARWADEPTNATPATASFTVTRIAPGIDSDGDTFYLLYKSGKTAQVVVDTAIDIKGGSDADTLVMTVFPGPQGDGFVALDSIASDHGLKRIELKGSVKVVRTLGPVGSLRITGGMLGELCVSNGGIGSVVVRNVWVPAEGSFVGDVGIGRSIYADGSIGSVVVSGGTIGSPDEPAVVRSGNGDIRSVMTRNMKKSYADMGSVSRALACEDGANISASVLAPGGSIGTVAAQGGTVGSPFDYPLCEISASRTIGKVCAKAMAYDGSAVGGSVYADITAGGAIGSVEANGGDISSSEICDPTDLDDDEMFCSLITAGSIGSVRARVKLIAYNGSTVACGGNILASVDAQREIGSVAAIGGNARIQANVHASNSVMGAVTVRARRYKEYPDDDEPSVCGGNLLRSMLATTPLDRYKSSDTADYRGLLKSLKVTGTVKNSWVGFKGPDDSEHILCCTFPLGTLENSEVWEAKRDTIYVRR